MFRVLYRFQIAPRHQLRQILPETEFQYRFDLYGTECDLSAASVNLYSVPVYSYDDGEFIDEVMNYMPQLRYVDMDSVGLSMRRLEEINLNHPDVKVVFRVFFGDNYTARTDAERILASNPGIGGELTPENTQSLKYCTKVKYLDLGHNSYMKSIDFVRYMPDLEATVLAMGNWSDVSPLASCPKLRYAELQTTCINDLRPLARLQNLTDLNLCYNFALHDITPLYDMPQLQRVYLGMYTPVPAEQVAELQARTPTCEINTSTENPTDGKWRYTAVTPYGNELAPAYEWLREVMRYEEAPGSYSYSYNDPLY